MAAKDKSSKSMEPTIENRKARHDYFITETLECGIKLTGTEVKSVRHGLVSLGEGFAMATQTPVGMTLYQVHIGEYPPAGAARQHVPNRQRILLAKAREIRKLADASHEKGVTLVPLKMYFVRGRAKVLIGIGRGKHQADKRQDIVKREAKRDMDRAMSRRRG